MKDDLFNTMRPVQNGWYFADDILKFSRTINEPAHWHIYVLPDISELIYIQVLVSV